MSLRPLVSSHSGLPGTVQQECGTRTDLLFSFLLSQKLGTPNADGAVYQRGATIFSFPNVSRSSLTKEMDARGLRDETIDLPFFAFPFKLDLRYPTASPLLPESSMLLQQLRLSSPCLFSLRLFLVRHLSSLLLPPRRLRGALSPSFAPIV